MPNVRTPQLKKHPTGQYVIYWGGRDIYLGTELQKAKERYLEELDKWGEWQSRKLATRSVAAFRTVAEMAETFLGQRQRESGIEARRYHEKHLRRFLSFYGGARVEAIRPLHLQQLKIDMMPTFKPKTVGHDIGSVKTMFNWAMGLELIPAVNFDGIKKPSIGPPPDKSIPLPELQDAMWNADHKVRPWLMVNYLCFARPSEVVRIVHGDGEWTQEGVFRLRISKTDRVRLPRHLIVSELALFWLGLCRPYWTRLDSYSHVATSVFPAGPGRLRHSSATHLRQLGETAEDVDLLLGHAPRRASLTYAQPVWPSLVASSRRLAQLFSAG